MLVLHGSSQQQEKNITPNNSKMGVTVFFIHKAPSIIYILYGRAPAKIFLQVTQLNYYAFTAVRHRACRAAAPLRRRDI
jgi:hypothetical protein